MLSTSLAGLVTPRQAWLLLIGFGYSLAEQRKRNAKQRSENEG